MARLAISVVGGVAASLLFPGSQFAIGIGFAAGGILANLLFPPPDVIGPRLQDLSVNSSAYGRPIPKVFGGMLMGGNMFWSPGLVEHKKKESAGGFKGGGGKQSIISFTYTASFAIGFTEKLVGFGLNVPGFHRIWMDTKLAFDFHEANVGEFSKFVDHATLHLGEETELPDPVMEAAEGVGQVSAHRGMTYIMFEDLPLGDFGNRIPQIRAEIHSALDDTSPKTEIEGGTIQAAYVSFDRNFYWATRSKSPSFLDTEVFKIDARTYETLAGPITITATPAPLDRVNPAAGCTDVFGNLYLLMDDISLAPDGPVGIIQIDPNTLQAKANTGVLLDGTYGFGNRLFAGNFIDPTTGIAATRAIYGMPGAIRPNNNVPGGNFLSILPSPIGPLGIGEPDLAVHFTQEIDFDYPPAISFPDNGAPDGRGGVFYFGDEFDGYPDPADGGFTDVQPTRKHWLEVDDTGVISTGTFIVPSAHDISISGSIYHVGTDRIYVPMDLSPTVRPDVAVFDPTRKVLDTIIDGDVLPLLSNLKLDFGFDGTTHNYTIDSIYSETSDGDYVEIDPISKTMVRIAGGWSGSIGNNAGFNTLTNSIISHLGNGLHIDRRGANDVLLADIVEDLLDDVGFVAADYVIAPLKDFEGFNQRVLGFAVTNREPVRNPLEALAAGFFFHLVESDWKLKAIDRRNSPTFPDIVPLDDMGAYEVGSEAPPLVAEIRTQEIELPERVDLFYISKDRDYEDGSQHSKRIAELVTTQELGTVRLPIVYTDRQAKRTVNAMLYQAWVARERYQFFLPPKYLKYDAGDYLRVSVLIAGGFTAKRIFIASSDLGGSGLIQMEGIRDEVETYEVSLAGDGTPQPVPFTPEILGPPPPTTLILLDIPLLRDIDEGSGIYMGAAGIDTWPGAAIFKSLTDEGVSYVSLTAFVASQNALLGHAVDVLADGPTTIFDNGNSVTINLINSAATLDSKTEAEILNGFNAAILGEEIIQWKTAVLNGDGTYTISGLLRGRKGTEQHTATHVIGERFVGLSSATLQRIPAPSAEIGQKRLFKEVSVGSSEEDSTPTALILVSVGQKPLSPVFIKVTRDGSDNITITWIRRTRVGGEWRDNVDVPLSETVESYEVDILDAPGGVLQRTLTSATESVVYTIGDQTTDFGGARDPVDIEVFQLSSVVGRGFKTAFTG